VKTKARGFVGDGGDSNVVDGGSMVGSNEAVMSVAHMLLMSGNEDGCGNGHMGESGADAAAADWYVILWCFCQTLNFHLLS